MKFKIFTICTAGIILFLSGCALQNPASDNTNQQNNIPSQNTVGEKQVQNTLPKYNVAPIKPAGPPPPSK